MILDPPVYPCPCFDHPATDQCREMPQPFSKRALSFIQERGQFSSTTKELTSRTCHAPNGCQNKLYDNLTYFWFFDCEGKMSLDFIFKQASEIEVHVFSKEAWVLPTRKALIFLLEFLKKRSGKTRMYKLVLFQYPLHMQSPFPSHNYKVAIRNVQNKMTLDESVQLKFTFRVRNVWVQTEPQTVELEGLQYSEVLTRLWRKR